MGEKKYDDFAQITNRNLSSTAVGGHHDDNGIGACFCSDYFIVRPVVASWLIDGVPPLRAVSMLTVE